MHAEKYDAIELALTEALANAVVHGAKADPSKIVECDVVCNEDQSNVDRRARSRQRIQTRARFPNPLRGESVYSDHGRGIFLINQLMDEVKFLKNGTEIHMIEEANAAVAWASPDAARASRMPSKPPARRRPRASLLYRNPQSLHLAIQVAALQAQDFGGAADVAVILVELFQDVVTLVGGAGLMQA